MNARAFAAERKPAPADVRALAVQLMHALLVGEHLRQPHGDPKPSNLIIADHPGGGLFLQVQDWGLTLARQTQPPETLWFRAPELHAADHRRRRAICSPPRRVCSASPPTPHLRRAPRSRKSWRTGRRSSPARCSTTCGLIWTHRCATGSRGCSIWPPSSGHTPWHRRWML